MPKKESLQHKIDRVRPPRVQITYDVEVGGAIELKELPFVIGVLGDFVGKPEEALPALKNRKFVEIDPDNFNQVLAGMAPRLAYTVDNKMADDGSKMGIELKFNDIEDFEPDNVRSTDRTAPQIGRSAAKACRSSLENGWKRQA